MQPMQVASAIARQTVSNDYTVRLYKFMFYTRHFVDPCHITVWLRFRWVFAFPLLVVPELKVSR